MRYPKLKPAPQKRALITAFRGYEHTPSVSPGAFYDMQNLSGARYPLLSVRRRRTEVSLLDGNPVTAINNAGGHGDLAVLDSYGTLWCGGHSLPRLLDGTAQLSALDEESQAVTIAEPDAVYALLVTPGSYVFQYDAAASKWRGQAGQGDLAGGVFAPGQPADGMRLTVRYSYTLSKSLLRELVFLGSWVCVFPDGKYVNTAKLRAGDELTPEEDYGSIALHNACSQGGTVFEPCGADGTPWDVSWSDTAPASGYWVDTTEDTPTVRVWSQSQSLWLAVSPYVKCSVPGIARGLRAGDSVTLSGRFDSSHGGEDEVETVWCGDHILTAAWHDPGASNRDEGTNDYLIFPGLLSDRYEIEMTWHDQSFLDADRGFPTMDFVVEAGNRLWGCRWGDGVNELYGSKLGDFRNWYAFEGLSTDSYRVARGHDGPYTGAAVLGGCPLFFREDCLEKILPAAAGNHSVVTVSLDGIERGCAKSAVVIREKLYYKSPRGVCCYNGTLPVLVSQALGDRAYHFAVAGAWGTRYCVTMVGPDGGASLFVLDTETGLWYKEDTLRFRTAFADGSCLCYTTAADGPVSCMGAADDSDGVEWWAETGELIPKTALHRFVTRLRLTVQLDPGAELRVYLSYDGGPWQQKGGLRDSLRKSISFPIVSRRSDRVRLRLEGKGGMELQSLSWLTEAGSDVS